jgi:hypothetical protein
MLLLAVFFSCVLGVELLQVAFYEVFFGNTSLVFSNNVGALILLLVCLIFCLPILASWIIQNVLFKRLMPNYYLYLAAENMFRNKFGWAAALSNQKPKDYHAQLEKIISEYDPEKFFAPLQQAALRRILTLILILLPIMFLSLNNYICLAPDGIAVKDFWRLHKNLYTFSQITRAKIEVESKYANDGEKYLEPHFWIKFNDRREVDLWQGIFILSPSAEKLITTLQMLTANGVTIEANYLPFLSGVRSDIRKKIETVFAAVGQNSAKTNFQLELKRLQEKWEADAAALQNKLKNEANQQLEEMKRRNQQILDNFKKKNQQLH